MELNLKGKTALITGGSRGIGFGAARVLASEGVNIHITSRTAADLDAAKKKITDAYKVNVTCHPCDLAAEGAAEKLAAEVGDIDFLVNNAGAIPQGTVVSLDEKTPATRRIRQDWPEGRTRPLQGSPPDACR